MKTIINKLAQTQQGLSQADFEAAYRKEHSSAEVLTAENIRQAYSEYRKAARKIKRVSKGRDGTVGPDRIPR